jgi:chromosome segregation ATPase
VKVKLSHRKASRRDHTQLPDYVSYSVVFSPGPIGLELDEDNLSAIRVQKFVDGGLQNPGAARKSGLIQPGDEVIAVNGEPVTSYEQTLELLQEQTTTREMTFRRPCDKSIMKATPKTTGRIGRTIQITPNPSLISLRAVESEPRKIASEQEVDNLLSPAHVKALPHQSRVVLGKNKRAALQKIVDTVAGVVPIRNYGVGSIQGSNFESSRGSDSSNELRSAFEQKYDLLQELSQAKIALHQQKELIAHQNHHVKAERWQMEEELMISRREKQMAEASLAAYRNTLQKQQADEIEQWKLAFEDVCAQNDRMRQEMKLVEGIAPENGSRNHETPSLRISSVEKSKVQDPEASDSLLQRDVEIFQARLEASERQLLHVSEKMEEQESIHKREVSRLNDLLSSKIRAFEEERSRMALELRNMQGSHEAEKRLSSEDKETMKKNLHDLLASLREDRERAEATFLSRIKALENELQHQTSLLDERNDEISRLRGYMQRTEHTIKDLEKNLEFAEVEKSQQQDSLNALHRELMILRDSSSVNQEKYQQELNELSDKNKKQSEIIISQSEEMTATARRLHDLESKLNETVTKKSECEEKLYAAGENVRQLERELLTWPARESMVRKEEEERLEVLLGKEKAIFEATLAEARQEVAEIAQKCTSLESSKSISQQEIASLRRENEELVGQMEELRNALDGTEAQLSEKRMEVLKLDDELQDVRDSLARAQGELTSCKSSLEAANTQYSDLSAHFSKTNESYTTTREEMNCKIVELTEECSSLRSQKATMETILRSIRKSASESEDRCARLRLELQREREEALAHTKVSERTFAASQEALSSIEAKYSGLVQEKSCLEEQLSTTKELNSSLKDEVESLRRKNTHAENAIQSSRTAHFVERKELESNLEAAKVNCKELSESLKDAELEATKLKKDLKEQSEMFLEQKQRYEADIEVMSRKQVALLFEKDIELDKLRASVSETERLRRDLQDQEDQLACALSNVRQLENTVERLRCNLVQKTALEESRDAEVERAKAEVAECEARLVDCTEQLNILQGEIQKRNVDISVVKREKDQLLGEKVKLLKSLRETEDDLFQLNHELEIARMEQNNLSSDSSNDDYSGLTRDKLKQMCVSFQENIRVLERRASEAMGDSARRQNQVNRLVEDIALLSSEIEKLVEANDKLNEHLLKVNSEKSNSFLLKESLEQKTKGLEDDLAATHGELQNQRRINASLSESITGLRQQIDAAKVKLSLREKQYKAEIEFLKQSVSEADKTKVSTGNEVSRLSTEVQSLKQEIDACLIKTRETERALSAKNLEYEEYKRAQDAVVIELNQEVSRYENRSTTLKSECNVLRRRVTELEMEGQSQRSLIEKLSESESNKDTTLSRHYSEIEEMKREHKTLSATLFDVQRLASEREAKIEQLERQVAGSNVTISNLSQQVQKYQDTLKKVESSAETSGNYRSQEVQEIELRCSLLEEERASFTHEISCLRGDLRKSRNDLHESEMMYKSLKSRHDNMKLLVDSSKTELIQARESKEEAALQARKSVTELENKQMELDQFRTQVKLLTATISRMKADYAMLQESAVQNELKAAASVQAQAEINKLKAELRKTKAKLDSVAAHKINETASAPDTFEEQLLQFIEDVIQEADSVFQDILRHSNIVCDSSSMKEIESDELTALDLATSSTRQTKLENVRDSMDSLSLIIPKAISYLNEKLELLQEWKKHRKSYSEAKTPCRKRNTSKEASSPILETLEKMKAVLTEDLMSPCRNISNHNNRPDPEILQKVIMSLEGQIDSLLSDLKAANDALRAKEQLFADLEDLVHHHETERDILERKLESMSSRLKEEERREEALVDEMSLVTTSSHNDNAQKLAIQLACKVMNGDRQLRVALAFQHWSTFTATSCDVSMHSQAASALVQELETTREKLAILKKHLKRSRRGREPTLDRIIEGFVVESS